MLLVCSVVRDHAGSVRVYSGGVRICGVGADVTMVGAGVAVRGTVGAHTPSLIILVVFPPSEELIRV